MKIIEKREYILGKGWVQLVSGDPSLAVWEDPKSEGEGVMSLSMAVATQQIRDNKAASDSKEKAVYISNEEPEEKEEGRKKRKRKNTEPEE